MALFVYRPHLFVACDPISVTRDPAKSMSVSSDRTKLAARRLLLPEAVAAGCAPLRHTPSRQEGWPRHSRQLRVR
jgi:hypothetical protein